MAMGLRPLDLANWLEVDDQRDEELALKSSLLSERRNVVVGLREEGLAGSKELLEEVVLSLSRHHAMLPTEVDESEHPLVSAARLVQEDLCVLVKSDTWRLQAACVCFPSRWNLASKIGTTMDEIHSPVPLYDEKLSSPTNAFFDRMTSEKAVWRLNWTLIDNKDLHQPTSARQSPQGDLSKWFFRVERQTLRQLPRSGAIIFTIRNYVASARELYERDAEFGPTLLRSLETAPEEMQAYKGWLGVAERLRDSLSS